jgi:nucleotide-binding universal stress UspA family protein
MKKILVPFDYSEASVNAAEYAIGIGKFFDAKLVLFHVYQLPVVTAEASFIQYPLDELHKENVVMLKKERSRLQNKLANDLPIDVVVRSGFPGSNIIEEAEKQGADMIVMGITGRNKLGEVLIGSTAVFTARNSEIPVLIVPSEVKYKKIRKIAFACDYDHTEEGGIIEHVELYRFLFDAQLDIVNVYDEDKEPTLEKAISGLTVENTLSHVPHKTFFVHNDDASEGLEDYLEKHKPDLLIVVPKKHNLFEKMFRESMTRHLAYHAHIPVLALHRKDKQDQEI